MFPFLQQMHFTNFNLINDNMILEIMSFRVDNKFICLEGEEVIATKNTIILTFNLIYLFKFIFSF